MQHAELFTQALQKARVLHAFRVHVLFFQNTHLPVEGLRALRMLRGMQEKQILDSISEYFKHEIPEVPYNDEDEFVNVLKEAGLTDG